MTEKQFPDIGIVHFLKKKGCRRVILRVKTDGEVYVTMPWLYSQILAEQFVRSSSDWILAQQQKKREHNHLITLDTELYTHFHSVEIVQGVDNSFRYSIQKDRVKILVPHSVKIENAQIQDALQNVMISVLRKEAIVFLPNRVEQLASLRSLFPRRARFRRFPCQVRKLVGAAVPHKNAFVFRYLL